MIEYFEIIKERYLLVEKEMERIFVLMEVSFCYNGICKRIFCLLIGDK